MKKPDKNLPPSVDRRHFKRATYGTSLEIQSVATSEGGNVYEVMHERVAIDRCDLSEAGMGLCLPFPAELGSILKIRCRVGPEPLEVVEVFARVVWSKGKKTGVRFLMLENEARETIRGIVREAMAQRKKRDAPPE